MSTDFQSDTAFSEPETPMVAPQEPESTAEALGDEATRQIQQVWEKVSSLLGGKPEWPWSMKRIRRLKNLLNRANLSRICMIGLLRSSLNIGINKCPYF